MHDKDESVTFRVRGKGETINRGRERKMFIEKAARKLDIREAHVIRTAIDEFKIKMFGK